MTDYPDLSQPLFHDDEYPDLSQPIANQQQGAPQGAPQANAQPSLWDRYQNFMQPKTVDSQGRPMQETFLGRMPDPRLPGNQMKPPSKEDFDKAAGLATMFMAPEVKLAGMLPGAISKLLPQAGTAARVVGDAASNIFKTGAGGYLGAKTMGLDEQQSQKTGLTSGEFAFGLTPLSLMFGSMNPMVRMMAGAGLGAVGGYGANQAAGGAAPTGLAEGGGAITGALMGLGKGGMADLAAMKTIGQATPQQVATMNSRLGSAKTAGVDMNMLEALGTPWANKTLESLGTTPKSANIMAQRSMQRVPQEQNSINTLMDSISPKDTYAQLENPLYKQATAAEVPAKELAQIYQDPYLKTKIDQVLADPLNSDVLKGVSPTSLKVLDLVKRKIDAERYGQGVDKYEAARLKEKSAKITDIANNASPKLPQDIPGYKAGTPLYEMARDVSEKRQTRDSILGSINQAEMNGSNFYDTWLKDDDKFNQLRYHLRDRENPNTSTPAQVKLDAMRDAFPHLIDPMGRSAAKQLGEANLDMPKSIKSGVGQMFNNLLLNRYNKAVADLIWKPDWNKELAQIAKMKSGEDKGIALGRVLSQAASTGSAALNQYNQQGSSQYGTGQ